MFSWLLPPSLSRACPQSRSLDFMTYLSSTVFPWLTPLGSYFFNTSFEGSYSSGGVVICSLLTERNSFQTDAKLSLLGQRTSTQNGLPGSFSLRAGVIFRCWCQEGGVNREGELFKEIRYVAASPSFFSCPFTVSSCMHLINTKKCSFFFYKTEHLNVQSLCNYIEGLTSERGR